MKIVELLSPEAIIADMKSTEKSTALIELTDLIVSLQGGLDRDEVFGVLQERERLGSTGIGDGVAIPHGKLKNLEQLLLAFGCSKAGVDFDSMDGKPAHLFFLLLAPEESVGIHLKTLARISKLLKSPAVRESLLDASGSADLFRIITEEENKL
ncbi:MAG: PTS sugar transporter subunit IIA [Desulfuromonadales bacterium]|nr:PTS sugar transporter subunit IIA [Desulfuromonadales bacterium]